MLRKEIVCGKYYEGIGWETGSAYTTSEYLCVNNCGYTHVIDKDITTRRQQGRSDILLTYILKGSAIFYFNGREQHVAQGQIAILKPQEPHHYINCAKDKSLSYWIHFTGTGAEALLKSFGLWEQSVYNIGEHIEIENIVMRILWEIRLQKPEYEKMCAGHLMQLLSFLSRSVQLFNTENNQNYKQLAPAIESMYNECHHQCGVNEYAAMCNFSPSHFIYLFKHHTGLPPLAFRQKIRIDKAKNLLTSTNLPVAEIGRIVGYNDSFYFSRLFHKTTGLPPNVFRRNRKDSEQIKKT